MPKFGMIKYAHNTYDGRTQKDTVGRYIFLIPEVKTDSCPHDTE